MGWPEHSGDVHEGCERFFRPSYRAHLVDSWLPAVGVADRLRAGAARRRRGLRARRVDHPDGAPRSPRPGSSAPTRTPRRSTSRAEGPSEAGVADRVRFEVADAAGFSGTGFDLVATFDSLHDMGDPVGAARHVPLGARRRRRVDGRRADGRRPCRGQPHARWAVPTTASRPCSAPRPRSRRRWGWRSARRPGRRGSGRWSSRPVSDPYVGLAAQRRRDAVPPGDGGARRGVTDAIPRAPSPGLELGQPKQSKDAPS